MKKIFLALSLMIASLVNVNAQGTYRGFLDVAPSIGNGFSFDITTAHGYQFNRNWFLGAGVGLVNIIETIYEGAGQGCYEELSIPIFAKVRFDNLSEKELTFFAEGNIGYAVVCDGEPIYASLIVGMRKRLTERMGLNFGVGFSIVPSASWDYGTDQTTAPKFNIKVGIDF